MFAKFAYRALLAGSALLAAASAQAIMLDYDGVYEGGQGVSVSAPPSLNPGTIAGTMTFKKDGSTSVNFYSYCVQLTQYVNTGNVPYDVLHGLTYFGTPQAQPNAGPGVVVDRLAKLFSISGVVANALPTVGSFGSLSVREIGAAIQLAVWESIYETGSSLGLSGTGSTFNASSSNAGVIALANQLLSNVQNFQGSVSTSHIKILSRGRDQDFILIPEPATVALAGLALFGLGLARRRS